ncbi:MAG TPA: IS200/IS605 family transposase [Verrucomicrobiales bacterium]|nr:IS200/IS605 family transposase [Verrucomicrobiales bacterium]
MPQSLSLVIVHIIFSTKNRQPWIDPSMRPRLHAYLATVARDTGCEAYRVGGVADHVHLALTLPRTITQSDLVRHLKTASNHWLGIQDVRYAGFAWQRGYGIFSIGKSQLPGLVRYIDDQESHHKIRTFQDELREFLKRYELRYEEAYVWD